MKRCLVRSLLLFSLLPGLTVICLLVKKESGLVVAGLLVNTAHAQEPQGKKLSLDEAVARVRGRNEGRILSAETTQVDGVPVHRIKVLKDGRVRILLVNTETGEFIK